MNPVPPGGSTVPGKVPSRHRNWTASPSKPSDSWRQRAGDAILRFVATWTYALAAVAALDASFLAYEGGRALGQGDRSAAARPAEETKAMVRAAEDAAARARSEGDRAAVIRSQVEAERVRLDRNVAQLCKKIPSLCK